MSDEPKEDETPEVEEQTAPTAEKPEQSAPDPADPLGIKKTMTSIGLLIIVGGVLVGISVVGPGFSEMLGDTVNELVGNDISKEEKDEEDSAEDTDEPAPTDEPEPTAEKPAPTKAAAPETTAAAPALAPKKVTDPVIANARPQLEREMDSAKILHVAISSDKNTMLVAYLPKGESKRQEVILKKDEWNCYVSAEDGPFEPPIKIFPPE